MRRAETVRSAQGGVRRSTIIKHKLLLQGIKVFDRPGSNLYQMTVFENNTPREARHGQLCNCVLCAVLCWSWY